MSLKKLKLIRKTESLETVLKSLQTSLEEEQVVPPKTSSTPDCPLCNTNNTQFRRIGEHNGVIGPGGHFHVLDSFWECQDCGIRFNPKQKNGQA